MNKQTATVIWPRLIGVLFVAISSLLWSGWVLRQQIADRRSDELKKAESAPSSQYGCIDDIPVPTATAFPLKDATDEIGLHFEHTVGPLGSYYVPESVGAGAAWGDFDSDGRLDLLMVNGEKSPNAPIDFPTESKTDWAVYQGTSDGLVEMTSTAKLTNLGFGMGCSVGDLDNDGDPDVYVTCVKQDRLLLNLGNFQFRDVAIPAGIEESEWGTGVSFFDFDRDGWLDIVVANYTHDETYDHQVACGFRKGLISYCGPHKFSHTVDRLYHNEGVQRTDGEEHEIPHFTDVTDKAGMSDVVSYGFTVVTADLTGDDWPDILIANDSLPNRFWVNQQNGTFQEEAVQHGIALNGAGAAQGNMGIALGDFDRNAKLDAVISELSTESTTLYQNSGDGLFYDNTLSVGLQRPTLAHTGWGAALIDLDHDGWLDLPLVNGLVIPCHSRFAPHGEDTFQTRVVEVKDEASYWHDYADRNLLLMSTGLPIFRDGTNDEGGDFTRSDGSGRCLLYGDPDEDGDLDLLVTNCGQRARYYRNDFPKRGHWTRFRLLTEENGRDAIGTQITLHCGSDHWTSVVAPCTSFLASHDPRVHFGIGEKTHVDRVIVRWADGPVDQCVEEFPGGPVDQDRILVRGTGKAVKEIP